MRHVPVRFRQRPLARLLLRVAPLALAAQALSQVGSLPHPIAPTESSFKSEDRALARLLDPIQARNLGLSFGWQVRLPLRPEGALKGIRPQAAQPSGSAVSSVFAWDDDGVILNMEPSTGEVRWRSLTAMQGAGNAMIDVASAATSTVPIVVGLGDTFCLMLDARTGSELGRMRYPHVPATPATLSGGDLVFGGRGGHLVWLGFRDEKVPSRLRTRSDGGSLTEADVAAVHCVAYEEQVHRLRGGFSATPVAHGDAVLACSTSGQVSCFRSSLRMCRWSIELPGGVVAPPALDQVHCYVASRDQHLRCIDLASGKTIWKWFCESPLENPPLLAGDLVMLQVPDFGLTAFEAGVAGGRTRTPRWKSSVPGNPITVLREGVLVWDATSRQLSLVDSMNGFVRQTCMLPDVMRVLASSPMGGEIYLMSQDGRVERCTPASPILSTAAPPAASEITPAPEQAPPTDAPVSPSEEPSSEGSTDPAGT